MQLQLQVGHLVGDTVGPVGLLGSRLQPMFLITYESYDILILADCMIPGGVGERVAVRQSRSCHAGEQW